MMICQECNLPMAICNALALYRLGADEFERDPNRAKRDFAFAKEEHDRYLDNYKSQE